MGLKATSPGRGQNREPEQVWGGSRAFLFLHLRAGPPWNSGCDPDLLEDPRETLPCSAGEPACKGVLLVPLHPSPNTPTCLFQPQASSGSCTVAPRDRVKLNGNAAAGGKESWGPLSWDLAKWTVNSCLGTGSSIPDLRKSQPQPQPAGSLPSPPCPPWQCLTVNHL